jgi:hypothetical protein
MPFFIVRPNCHFIGHTSKITFFKQITSTSIFSAFSHITRQKQIQMKPLHHYFFADLSILAKI